MDNICLTVISIIAILVGPVCAVFINQYLQNRKIENDAKRSVLINLVAYRGNRLHINFVTSLNIIEIVFHKNKQVIKKWHEHFENLHIPLENVSPEDADKIGKIVDDSLFALIAEIANSLGYRNLRQADLSSSYTPKGHISQSQSDEMLRWSTIEFLNKSVSLIELLLANAKNAQSGGGENDEKNK